MKYAEHSQLIASLRELADWLESNPRTIELPKLNIEASSWIYEYGKDETGAIDYSKSDEFLTRLKMRKIARALGSCDKKHVGAWFKLTKHFGNIELRFTTSRESVCEKKVVAVEEIPAQMQPAYTREVVEWECRDSLLAG